MTSAPRSSACAARGSVHFTPERPIPDDLLRALIHARVADVRAEA
jgi:uncharacterized protein YdhG (YjbR/CyaY superfamily)